MSMKACQLFMSRMRSARMFVTGYPGAGKSTLVNTINHLDFDGVRAMDIDWLGFRGPANSKGINPWIVNPHTLSTVLDLLPSTHVVCGTCENAWESIPFSYVDDAGARRIKDMPSVVSLPWDGVLFLAYEPTKEELDRRFGAERALTHSVSMGTVNRIADLIRYKPRPLRDVVYVDVTGCRNGLDMIEIIEEELERV